MIATVYDELMHAASYLVDGWARTSWQALVWRRCGLEVQFAVHFLSLRRQFVDTIC
jgi:hypothetical protein